MVAAPKNNLKDKIIFMIVSDLSRFGIKYHDGNVIENGSFQGSVKEYSLKTKKDVYEHVANLKKTWNSIPIFLAEDAGVITSEGCRLLTGALFFLDRKCKLFSNLHKTHAHKAIVEAMNSDTSRWSDKTAEDISAIAIKIDMMEHEIRKKAFIVASLLHLDYKMEKMAQQNGTSVQGAYSNLDLPMAERWYLWKDVDEEVEGRRDSIRSQERYRMGLEDSDPTSVKEGFYWRELRNEPYKFDVLYPDSPYPYRSALWGNP